MSQIYCFTALPPANEGNLSPVGTTGYTEANRLDTQFKLSLSMAIPVRKKALQSNKEIYFSFAQHL